MLPDNDQVRFMGCTISMLEMPSSIREGGGFQETAAKMKN